MSVSTPSGQAEVGSGLAESAEVEQLIDHLQRRGRLEVDSPTALYKRLEDALRSAIQEGIVPAGAMIPGERELAQRLDLSRVTVRKALKGLVDHADASVPRLWRRTDDHDRGIPAASGGTTGSREVWAAPRLRQFITSNEGSGQSALVSPKQPS